MVLDMPKELQEGITICTTNNNELPAVLGALLVYDGPFHLPILRITCLQDYSAGIRNYSYDPCAFEGSKTLEGDLRDQRSWVA